RRFGRTSSGRSRCPASATPQGQPEVVVRLFINSNEPQGSCQRQIASLSGGTLVRGRSYPLNCLCQLIQPATCTCRGKNEGICNEVGVGCGPVATDAAVTH